MDLSWYKDRLQKSIEFLKKEFTWLQVGRSSKWLVENIVVRASYWDMPVGQLANITLPDNQSIKIEPWDKSILSAIEKAIYDAWAGLTPRNEWSHLLLIIPPLTKDRREEIVKRVKSMWEDMKARMRQIRQDELKKIKMALDAEEISEDEKKWDENKVTDIIKDYNAKVDELVKLKSEDILKL